MKRLNLIKRIATSANCSLLSNICPTAILGLNFVQQVDLKINKLIYNLVLSNDLNGKAFLVPALKLVNWSITLVMYLLRKVIHLTQINTSNANQKHSNYCQE